MSNEETKELSKFKTFCQTELKGAIIANLIGGLIFYWIDIIIFQGFESITSSALSDHLYRIPLYLLRWQLSTPILAVVMSKCKK